ncbi:MAG: MBL fold metallo-hydrolase [Ignavibacteriae bacterium]|nr:MBL fold metallo-hydrolase [Ignavibacteriota bacterium]
MFKNIGNNFNTPEKVVKIKNPIKDNVELSALWVGHVTVLLQIFDKVIITDPYLNNNIAEIQKRVVETGIEINDLDKCDIILLSHSHFDHLQLGSLKILSEKFPYAKLVFPLGLEEFLPDYSFDLIPMRKAEEQNKIYTGEVKYIDGVKITTVAAFHWGGRYGLDGLIWGEDAYTGFIIEYKGITVYFAGDTSYDDYFYKWLGDNYNIDLSIIPIGPCTDCTETDKPGRHLYPKGSLKVLEDTKSEVMIPVHYGTIIEKSHPDKPVEILKLLIKEDVNSNNRVKILKIGEQIILK